MSALRVSVVCSTYNRATRLRSLLDALEAQTLPKDQFEVVIVANGCEDNTNEVLAEYAERGVIAIAPVTLEVNRGASGGRNAGWRAARAPLVAFTDDDCVPQPEWLANALAFIEAHEPVVLVGKTVPNPAQRDNNGPFSRTQNVSESAGTRFMHTCNIVYRRADLEAVQGFDEAFKTKGGEDTDLGWRILDRSGGEAQFAADALVLHDISKGSFKAALKEALYWRDIPLVAARHPKRARPLMKHRLFWKPSHEYVLLSIGSVVVAAVLRNPIPLVASLPWLWFRGKKSPVARGKAQRVAYLPLAYVIDAAEVTTMVRGSVKHRTVVL